MAAGVGVRTAGRLGVGRAGGDARGGLQGLRQGAALAGLDDDVGELLGIDQPAQGVDGQLELLALGNRLLADLAGGDLQVLLGDGGHDVQRAEVRARPVCRGRARPAGCSRAGRNR